MLLFSRSPTSSTWHVSGSLSTRCHCWVLRVCAATLIPYHLSSGRHTDKSLHHLGSSTPINHCAHTTRPWRKKAPGNGKLTSKVYAKHLDCLNWVTTEMIHRYVTRYESRIPVKYGLAVPSAVTRHLAIYRWVGRRGTGHAKLVTGNRSTSQQFLTCNLSLMRQLDSARMSSLKGGQCVWQ